MYAFPRFLSCGVAMVLLAGCAHQPSANTSATPKVDAASALQISPLDDPKVITTEHQVVTGPNSPRRGIVDPDVYDQALIPVEVLRTGRYQLVTMQAPMEQRYLLEQIPESVTSAPTLP